MGDPMLISFCKKVNVTAALQLVAKSQKLYITDKNMIVCLFEVDQRG